METGRAFMNVVRGSSAPAIKRGDIPVIDPSDGQEFTTIARGGSEDVDVGVLAGPRGVGERRWWGDGGGGVPPSP